MAIFDVRITDTDAASTRHIDPAKVLRRHEKEKKDKYGDVCRDAHLNFTPLVFSVDGMECTEATAARKHLAARLAAKWNLQQYRPHLVLWVAGTGQQLYR